MERKTAPRHEKVPGGKDREISPEDAAALLGVHPRTIRNLLTKKAIIGLKVGGRWFIDRQSVERYKEEQNGPSGAKAPSSSSLLGPRVLAPYRLCLHAFELFPWASGNASVDLRVISLQHSILENLGAGFYSYGAEKKLQYTYARSAIGSLIGLVHPYREKVEAISKAIVYLEEECVPAVTSLLRKIEHNQGKYKAHAAAASL